MTSLFSDQHHPGFKTHPSQTAGEEVVAIKWLENPPHTEDLLQQTGSVPLMGLPLTSTSMSSPFPEFPVLLGTRLD